MTNRGVQSETQATLVLESAMTELYEKSGGAALGLGRAEFAVIVHEIVTKYLAPNATEVEVTAFCVTLRLEELALARACAAGHEPAWETFLLRYREKLYDIANYIAKESSSGRELADSLYADLYGTTLRDGKRVSKLASYSGRGSLEGWLRTVMAQEHVNRFRRVRRLVSLDEESEEGVQFAAANVQPEMAVDSRLVVATDEVLAALPDEDRFVLAACYLDGRKLAEIARMLGVHESTISRKLDKLAKSMRKQILAKLGQKGMSRRQAEEALEVDVRDLQLNLHKRLAQEARPEAFSRKDVEEHSGEGGKQRTGAPGDVKSGLSPATNEISDPEGLGR